MPLVAFWDSPTAQMSLAETMATAKKRLASVLGLGLETTLQLLPFHCSISVPLPLSPTAHTSLVETAATPKRSLNAPSGLGLGTMLHAVPSQCKVSVWSLPRVLSLVPTAQTSLAETLATAWSSLFPVEALGLWTTVQAAACATAGASSRASSTAATTPTKRLTLKCFMLLLTLLRAEIKNKPTLCVASGGAIGMTTPPG